MEANDVMIQNMFSVVLKKKKKMGGTALTSLYLAHIQPSAKQI